MDVLIRYGFTIDEIKNIMNSNQYFENINDKDIYSLIDILGKCGCMSNHIKNIFITNPFIFNRKISDILDTINFLSDIGLNNLFILFDTNPYILNIDYKELNRIYKKVKKEYNDLDIVSNMIFELKEVI